MGLKVCAFLPITVFFLVFLTSFSLFSTNANAWLSGWGYRKSHIIVGSTAGAQTNYQMNITVYNITGTSSGSNVYIGNKAKSNFGDIRFTDSSDNLLDYWIESTGTNFAKFWVEIPSIPASPATTSIYIYYGNVGATTQSNGLDTFLFFDDFDIFDTNKWSATGGYSVGSSQLTITTGSVYSDNRAATQPGVISEAKVKWNNFASYSGLEIANASSTQGSNAGSNKLVYLMTASGGGTSVQAWGANGNAASYNIVSGTTQFTATAGTTYILGHAINSSHVALYKDRSITNSYSGTWSAPFYLWLGYFTGSAAGTSDISDIVVDWVLVRKYTSPEPTQGSWGIEETSPFAAPQITRFFFSTTLDQININWFTEYGEAIVNVECKLNNVQNCVPPTYSGAPGGGGCTILSPQYLWTQASSGELRTVPNNIYCKAYDPSNPSSFSEITRVFYPLSFEVYMPSSMSLVVGEGQDLVITIKNNGTLNDTYSVSATTTRPQILVISDGTQRTESLDTNDVQQMYVGVNILTSGETANADVRITSATSQSHDDIVLSRAVVVRGGVKSLSEFDIFGVLQIMFIAAAALVTFLF